MTTVIRPGRELKPAGYEIFIGLLSILSIVNIVLFYLIDDDDMDVVLVAMNGLLTVIFLVDFFYRLRTAPRRGAYFWKFFGWADLLSSLPFPEFKIFRLFRLAHVVHLLRQQGPGRVRGLLLKDRAGSALIVLLLLGLLVLEFGSLLMLQLEQYAPGANILTGSDAIWYVIVTISTVGYGDKYPVTDLGRIGGSAIIILGVAIFGTFTGYLANVFLSKRESDSDELPPPVEGGES